MPDTIDDDSTSTTYLSHDQLARVAGLRVGADILASKGFASRGALEPDPLIDIAHYVVTGRDRWLDRADDAASVEVVGEVIDAEVVDEP